MNPLALARRSHSLSLTIIDIGRTLGFALHVPQFCFRLQAYSRARNYTALRYNYTILVSSDIFQFHDFFIYMFRS